MKIRQLLAICVLTLAGTAAAPAFAHAKLVSAEPRAASQLDAAPREIRLHFNEALEPAFSTIALSDASQAEIALPAAAPDKADASTLVVALPVLRAGSYRVRWTAMTHDGHKTKGEFGFQIK